jgi:hypothetical protein
MQQNAQHFMGHHCNSGDVFVPVWVGWQIFRCERMSISEELISSWLVACSCHDMTYAAGSPVVSHHHPQECLVVL